MAVQLPSAVPTTVFTGFLGSGKTTIISLLIDELQNNGEQVIYIKNEIGNENVDAALLKGKQIETKELLNGCICCTLVGPFITAVDEIIETFKPTRIIIEASGAADPAALALMIDSQPNLYRDGVIAIIDVVNFEGYIDISVTAQNQTKFTDLIVFNKIELVDLQRKQAVVGYVRELNTHSPVVEAPKGILTSAVAFGLSTRELNSLLESDGFEASAVEEGHHPHQNHLSEDEISSFVISLPDKITSQQLEVFLNSLPTAVYRVKGIINFATGEKKLINKVGSRLDMTNLELDQKQPNKNILVIIGFSIQDHKAKVEELLKSAIKE